MIFTVNDEHDQLIAITLSYTPTWRSAALNILDDIKRLAVDYESRTGSPATHVALGVDVLRILKCYATEVFSVAQSSPNDRVMGLQIARVLVPPDFIGICAVLDTEKGL